MLCCYTLDRRHVDLQHVSGFILRLSSQFQMFIVWGCGAEQSEQASRRWWDRRNNPSVRRMTNDNLNIEAGLRRTYPIKSQRAPVTTARYFTWPPHSSRHSAQQPAPVMMLWMRASAVSSAVSSPVSPSTRPQAGCPVSPPRLASPANVLLVPSSSKGGYLEKAVYLRKRNSRFSFMYMLHPCQVLDVSQ